MAHTFLCILPSANNTAEYYNQKGFHSIVVQALVDHKYRLLTSISGGREVCMTLVSGQIPRYMGHLLRVSFEHLVECQF